MKYNVSLHSVWSLNAYEKCVPNLLIFRLLAPIREVRQMKKRTLRLFLKARLLIQPQADIQPNPSPELSAPQPASLQCLDTKAG